MDPFTTFAAAGNVLQFVQFGVKLVAKSIEYINDGGDLEQQALQAMLQRLLVSTDNLRITLEKEGDTSVQPGPARALSKCNHECLAISSDFFDLLQSTKITDPQKSWSRVRALIMNLKQASNVAKFEKRINDARANLTISAPVYLSSKQQPHKQPPSTIEANLRKEIQQSQHLQMLLDNDIRILSDKISRLQVDDRRWDILFNSIKKEHGHQASAFHKDFTRLVIPAPSPFNAVQEELGRLVHS